MLRLLILVVVVALFIYLVKKQIRVLAAGASHRSMRGGDGRAKSSMVAQDELVGCAECGIHVPRQGATRDHGQLYCSPACQQRAADRRS